ncbi:MAG: MFS transporter [Acidobacteria bacterium]|nr:MFS transporter [Acidobacteriota bacterium]
MLILAAILAIFVYGIIAAMFGTIIPALAKKFLLSDTQAGFIFTAQALGMTIASISVGPLIDNKGKKPALLLGLGLVAAALYGLANASGDEMTVIFAVVLGVGGGIIVTGANALVSDINPEKRTSVMNGLNLFFGLGGMVTPLLASNLLSGDPVKLAYFAAVLTTVTLGVHFATKMPAPTGERGFKAGEMGALLSQPVLYLLAAFLFLYVGAEVSVWNWLAKHLIAIGVSESSALNILGTGFALGILIGRVFVARVLMDIPAPAVTLGAAVLMAITTYAMLQTNDPTMAGVAVFCAGLAMAPVFPTTLAMVGDAFPRATATAMGIVITCGWIGLLVMSPIIGSVASSSGLRTALLILPGASVLMILINLVMRPMLKKKAA